MQLRSSSLFKRRYVRFQRGKQGEQELRISKGSSSEELITLEISAASSSLQVEVEEDASASVLLFLSSSKAPGISLNIALAPRARLHLYCLEKASKKGLRVMQHASVQTGAQLRMTGVTLGGAVTHEAVSAVEGEDAQSIIDWLFHANQVDDIRLSVRNAFHNARGQGDVTVKGIVEGHAKAVCKGMVEIGEKGGGTDACLLQHVLMLDDTAKVDAVPALEIKTNDVRASHSATVTKVSQEDVFYMASRGIPAKDARRLYIRGFANDLLSKVERQDVRDVLVQALERRLQAISKESGRMVHPASRRRR
jgi:Fe-S cluster assembly scaffold protein SufB